MHIINKLFYSTLFSLLVSNLESKYATTDSTSIAIALSAPNQQELAVHENHRQLVVIESINERQKPKLTVTHNPAVSRVANPKVSIWKRVLLASCLIALFLFVGYSFTNEAARPPQDQEPRKNYNLMALTPFRQVRALMKTITTKSVNFVKSLAAGAKRFTIKSVNLVKSLPAGAKRLPTKLWKQAEKAKES